jgi:hypothetical protein
MSAFSDLSQILLFIKRFSLQRQPVSLFFTEFFAMVEKMNFALGSSIPLIITAHWPPVEAQ